ncbi:hypothetical protein MTX78_04220 [Hymenobacter tibetensis]|uniref:Uncharacterized protein n=1 Tax=Hymenobacter tibetensis TaxID=497967 RepID=A0ABY4D3T7_9BACT|nr:hypothetical protein [Hymenobacter tibetensis]UOG75806.1 hypothetical protein MTX78_04220 [Hymenobacter tibetensis]
MLDKIQNWLENGQQIGKAIYELKDQQLYHTSVAIQKWQDLYKVSVTEIAEANMVAEQFDFDEVSTFRSFDEVVVFFAHNSPVALLELKPLKGQKLFNPAF